jgi:hypothetical protein
MKAVCFSESLVSIYKSTRRYCSEDHCEHLPDFYLDLIYLRTTYIYLCLIQSKHVFLSVLIHSYISVNNHFRNSEIFSDPNAEWDGVV